MKTFYCTLAAALACLLLLAFAGNAPAGWNGNGGWKGPERSRSVAFQIDPASAAATLGAGKAAFTVPEWMGGWTLAGADCRVYTPGSGTGSLDVSVSRRSSSSEALMYSATVATGYTGRHGTATPANCAVLPGDLVTVGVTRIHATPSKGLWVTLTFNP